MIADRKACCSSGARDRAEVLRECREHLTAAVRADRDFFGAHVFRLVRDIALGDDESHRAHLDEFKKAAGELEAALRDGYNRFDPMAEDPDLDPPARRPALRGAGEEVPRGQ